MKMNSNWLVRLSRDRHRQSDTSPERSSMSPMWLSRQHTPSIVTLKYSSPSSQQRAAPVEFMDNLEKSRRRKLLQYSSGRLDQAMLSADNRSHSSRGSSTSTPPVTFNSADLLNSYPEVNGLNKNNNDYKHHDSEYKHHNKQDVSDYKHHSNIECERDRRKVNSTEERHQRKRSKEWEGRRSYSHREELRDRELFGSRNNVDSPERSDSSERAINLLDKTSQRNNYFKPNGVRLVGGSLSMGVTQFSSPTPLPSRPQPPVPQVNSGKSAKKTKDDDLVAMGTNWVPTPTKNEKSIAIGNAGNSTNSTLSGTTKKLGMRPIQPLLSGSQKKSKDPKYGDPLLGAPSSFTQRLAELSALEIETIRWEKARKVKKKPSKQD